MQKKDESNESNPKEKHDDQDVASLIDAFHQEAFDQVIPEFADDSELFGETTKESGDWQDDDFEPDEEEHGDIENTAADVMDADQPLYAGATITLAGSMILLIAFAMRHSLTGEALADLLVLLELHCLTPNLCQRNLKTFMDFFRSLKVPLQFHYYCQQCFLYHGTRKSDVCPNCNTHAKANSTSYFLVIPIVSQLTSLFADGTLIPQILAYKASKPMEDGILTDICDGNLYKERFGKYGFFHQSPTKDGQLHISFQLNTDGVSLFHSSTFSIWPVYFIINELPPHLRFSRSCRIFAGLWFGFEKPDFQTFLKPFAESLHDIYYTGLAVNNLTIRGILLNGVFDAPARCLFQNMVQFNGFYGCPYCEVPGKSVQTSERGYTLSYPFNLDSQHGHHQLRTLR
uniref:Uncharacterized protein LOC111114507 n=1 Tax=Crassostrea virginica TaxID=6565 RepID=A0A8B8BZ16_CRAVI|nr:uncharacterized protein LOC111114507 [Crassostrea virginica]